MSTARMDFIVIGAGIAGASAAYELAMFGDVVVLERESIPGYHTTGRSAAQLLESYGNLSTRRLTRGGRSFIESPPQGFTDRKLLSPRSALFFARNDQLGALDAMHGEMKTLTPGLERVDEAQAREIVPALREGYVPVGCSSRLNGHRRECSASGFSSRRKATRRQTGHRRGCDGTRSR